MNAAPKSGTHSNLEILDLISGGDRLIPNMTVRQSGLKIQDEENARQSWPRPAGRRFLHGT
jgi:hypothetical protein